MKLTLMRDNSGTLTMRTLDITLQIEAMKHETKARPIDEEDLDEQIIQEMMDEDDREGEEIWNRISGKNSRNTKNTKRNRNAR